MNIPTFQVFSPFPSIFFFSPQVQNIGQLETAAVVTTINYTPSVEEKHNLQDCILPAERAAVEYTWNEGK